MKKNLQRTVICLLVAALLLGGFALANTTQTINVIYRNIQLVVNGEPVTPRDAQGRVVEPFIFNGSTFLPIRAVSEALGYEVAWVGATSTAYIGTRFADVFRAAFVTQAMSNESQAFAWGEFQRLAPYHGFEMTVFAGENEPAVEFDGVLTAIVNGYDAVFVNPSSIEGIIPALYQARNAGLVVGMFSTMLPEEHWGAADFFVGSCDFLGGEQAGQFVLQNFPGFANFVEVGGQAGHSAAVNRHDGFRAGIANNWRTIELDSQFSPTGWNTHEAWAIMEDFIVMYGDDIDIVFCHWDNGATGVIYALQNAGMTDVFVIGMDGNRTGYAQVREGTQALSVGLSFTNMADESLRLARHMLEGGTVEFENWIPWDMITLETIDDFPFPNW